MSINKVSPRIVKSIAKSAATSSNRYHVLPREKRWVVRKDGAKRVSGIYQSKTGAINAAKQIIATLSGAYIVVHTATGKIEEIAK